MLISTKGRYVYERWAKGFNLKEMAKTFSYLREHDLLDRDELDRRASEASRVSEAALTRIQQIDARQREIRALRGHIIQYAKTRDVYAQYRKSNWSPKFASQHSREIADWSDIILVQSQNSPRSDTIETTGR